ncbi:MAG: type II secretion system F family protein [Candidatus Omnitrophica bacterium]|nr:type II secretion system F family protein [Candidatus Omnitrophota bacterium]
MTRYAFRGKTHTLEVVEGMIEAESDTSAVSRLNAGGIYPIRLNEAARETPAVLTGRPRVSSRALGQMSRHLAQLLGGGLPLAQALRLVAQQTESRPLRTALEQVSDGVRDGASLSEALADHPELFSSLYVSMVRAGETAGALEEVLSRLADWLEREAELTSRSTTALVYPAFVLGLGVLTVMVLVLFVVPKLAILFEENGQLLPLPTRLLLAASGGLRRWWWLALLAVTGTGWWAARRRVLHAAGRLMDRWALRMPVAGDFVRKFQIARFVRGLGLMVGQGVPLLQALPVAGGAVSSHALRRAVGELEEAVREGGALSGALSATKQFPPFVSSLAAVGEESGTLAAALLNIASTYDRDTDRLLKLAVTLLEPLLIVGVGALVMVIVVSMLLPVFELGLVAQE